MHYIDGKGSITMPKSVRTIIDYKETPLGNKKGAKRQFHYENLHIREYDDYYTMHRDETDETDPRRNSLGHLLVDASKYLTRTVSASYIGYKEGKEVHMRKKARCENQRTALYDAIMASSIADSAGGWVSSSYILSRIIRKDRST